MPESGPKFHTPVEELLAFWHQHPVVLASQSDFRKSQLESLGFADVSKSGLIPERLETDYAAELNEIQGIASYYADDGHDIVRHIAGAKVQYVLDHEPVDPNAIVLAFDTAPLIWRHDTATDDYAFEHLEKPKNTEDGQRLIHRIITTTALGCRIREEKIARLQQQFATVPAELRDETIANLTAVLDIGTISVVSAAAGSFPQARGRVLGFAEDVSLFSEAIYSMRHDDYALEILGNKVCEIMGNRVTQISGGIDFSDGAIQDLLKLSELKVNILQGSITGTDHYLGLSKMAFVMLLAHARGEAVAHDQK